MAHPRSGHGLDSGLKRAGLSRRVGMKCACPCGKEFEPRRSNQVYVNARHRQRDKDRRWPRKRQLAPPMALRNGPTERQEAQASGVPPLLGTEMAETKRDRLRTRWGRRRSNEFLTEFQVADLLGLGAWTLTKWRKRGKGPPFLQIGRNTVRYPRRELRAWVRASLNRSGKPER
jgi:predicted DNA-binding transcriptional regulator AlpA